MRDLSSLLLFIRKIYIHKNLQHNTHQTLKYSSQGQNGEIEVELTLNLQLIVQHKNTNDNKGDIKINMSM